MGCLIIPDGGLPDVQDAMGAVAAALQVWEGESEPDGAQARPRTPVAGVAGELARRLPLQSRLDGRAIIHSTRPRLGPWVIRLQVLVRRLTWWFLEPILQQIRSYQSDAARAIAALAQEQAALQAEVRSLRADLARSAAAGRAQPAAAVDQVEPEERGQ